MKWEFLGKLKSSSDASSSAKRTSKLEQIISILLENRGVVDEKSKKDFFNPQNPKDISLKDVGISEEEIKKAIARLDVALKNKEKVVVFGDYDADGITSTGILWETLHSLKFEAIPYIPDRFTEGYGLRKEQIKKLKEENPQLKLILTVDNGIVALEAVEEAKKLGIDVIITDHHLPGDKLPDCLALIHTTTTSGAGVSWIFSREIANAFGLDSDELTNKLDLAAIGIIADQMPLVGLNRSFAKYGIAQLQKTHRPGLRCLYDGATIVPKDIGTYHINYIIAPRINAMGRIKHGLDSLRFLCTTNEQRAQELSKLVASTNEDRQKIVEMVITETKTQTKNLSQVSMIVLASENYHEGVVGLAAARIVEEYYKPAIVFSVGEKYSKGSARSIAGVNIIDVLKEVKDLWIEGGGHSMAAGITIETKKIPEFSERINEAIKKYLTKKEKLEKTIQVDLELEFDDLTWDLSQKLAEFEPTGVGNLSAVFATTDVEVLDVKVLGNGSKHLKLKLKKEKVFDAVFWGQAENYPTLKPGDFVGVAYCFEINEWKGNVSLQLKLKDLIIS